MKGPRGVHLDESHELKKDIKYTYDTTIPCSTIIHKENQNNYLLLRKKKRLGFFSPSLSGIRQSRLHSSFSFKMAGDESGTTLGQPHLSKQDLGSLVS